jgi:hypothetical protein
MLLDLVKDFRQKADMLERDAETGIDPIGNTRIKVNASVYKEVADRPENVLRKVSRADEV